MNAMIHNKIFDDDDDDVTHFDRLVVQCWCRDINQRNINERRKFTT